MDQGNLLNSWGALATVIVILAYLGLKWITHDDQQLKASSLSVPAVGRPGLLGSWIDAVMWMWEARDRIQEGYDKAKYPRHGDHAFWVSTLRGWELCICSADMIKEYKNLMDDQMSALAVTAEAKYTLPGGDWDNIHQLPPQSAIARALLWLKGRAASEQDPYFAEMIAVFRTAFAKEIQIPPHGSGTVPCFPRYCRVVAAMTLKALLGSSATGPETIDRLCQYAEAVPRDGFLIAAFPGVLRPFVARLCTAPKLSEELISMVTQEIERRQESGECDPPQDMTDWMVRWVQDNPRYPLRGAVARVIATFFGGIHTTTQLIVHSLFEIATRPEYVQPLRYEIQEALDAHGGWTKAAIESMPKLDSFVKECQRYNPLDAASLSRQATCNFQFSNGLHLPKGTWIFAPNSPMVADSRLYPNAQEFDGLRFWTLGQQTQRPQDYLLVAPSPTYLQFGDGRHICPGRFMAADEVRLLLAYTVWHYDIGIGGDGSRPRNMNINRFCFPDMSASITLTGRR